MLYHGHSLLYRPYDCKCTAYIMEGQDQGDELYPIAVLIDELKVRNLQRLLSLEQQIPAGCMSGTDIPYSMTMSFCA